MSRPRVLSDKLSVVVITLHLAEDQLQLVSQVLEICARQNDAATTSLIEVWIDEAERRHVVSIRNIESQEATRNLLKVS